MIGRSNSGIPGSCNQLIIKGTSVANAVLTRSLPAAVGKVNYVTGFDISASPPTGTISVEVVLSGVVGGPLTFIWSLPTASNAGLRFERWFPEALQAEVNTAITLTCPALGAGNALANANLYGYVGPG